MTGLRTSGELPRDDVVAAMLQVLTQFVEAHGELVALVAALQGDVIELSDRVAGRSPAEVRADARALRGEAEQAGRHARRLVAQATSLTAQAVEIYEDAAQRDGDGRPEPV
jgi:hypothetical protein